MGFWRNLTTGKDNSTHDIVRVALTIVTMMFPLLIIWGILMLSLAWYLGKPFDLMSSYEAFGLIVGTFGTFLMQGGGALFFKRSVEPDGTQTTVESIIPGQKQPDVTQVTTTNIIGPDNVVLKESR